MDFSHTVAVLFLKLSKFTVVKEFFFSGAKCLEARNGVKIQHCQNWPEKNLVSDNFSSSHKGWRCDLGTDQIHFTLRIVCIRGRLWLKFQSINKIYYGAK